MIDVVVVAYCSSQHLRSCVEPLCGLHDLRVIVVDNACPEDSTSTLTGLRVEILRMGRNAGFATACNAGSSLGRGDAILFLNPDAEISPADVRLLASRLAADPSCGAIGPRILDASGRTSLSVRRNPRLRSAFGEALFLHYVARQMAWPTETVRTGYDHAADAEWLSGAALCVRRSAFEAVGGFDERFFLYSEDADLCLRIRQSGYVVRYDPVATAHHHGGSSAPRPSLADLNLASRITYVRAHERGLRYFAFRLAYALHELVRVPIAAVRSEVDLDGRVRAVAVSFGGTVALPPDVGKGRRDLSRDGSAPP